MSVEKLSRDVWSHHMEPKSFICRNCGLEKSRSFEDLGSCVCDAGAAMDNSLGIKRHVNSFRSGGNLVKRPRYSENGIKKTEENQLSNTDKAKGMPQAPDLESTQGKSEKQYEAAVHMRRFDDIPAVFPIKKRRIQIRSPSPAPRSPSPQTPVSRSSSPRVVSSARSPVSGRSPCATPVLSHHADSTVLSPRSVTQLPVSASKPEVLQQPALQPLAPAACERGGGTNASPGDNGVAVEAKDENLSTFSAASHMETSSRVEDEHPVNSIGEEICKDERVTTAQSAAAGVLEEVVESNLQDSVVDPNHVSDKQEGELVISESSSFSRDDRLHWDLNTEMTAWDASTEQALDKTFDDDEAAETPHRSPSAHSAETSQDHKNMGHETAAGRQVEEDQESRDEEEPEKEELMLQEGGTSEEQDLRNEVLVEDEPDTGDPNMEDPGMGEAVQEEEPEIVIQNTIEDSEQRGLDSTEREMMPSSTLVESEYNGELPDSGNHHTWDTGLSHDGGNDEEPLEVQFQGEIPTERSLSKSGKQARPKTDDGEGWDYASEEPELEEHVDYGDSDFRDADDVGLDVDDRSSLMQEENNWKAEDGTCHSGSLKRTSQEGDLSNVDGALNEQPPEQGLERHAPSGRSRTTGWDQLPQGFDSAEEALKAAKEVPARRGGRGGSWSSSVGRGSSLGSHTANRFGPGPGPGPGPARSTVRDAFSGARGDGYYRDRHPDELVYDRGAGYRNGRRPDDNFSTPARGRDPGRRQGLFGRGGGWIDSQPGHMNQWEPSRHRQSSGFSGPSNAAAAAAARAENSGFIVAPDGTLKKGGSGMGPGRGALRSTVSGGRGNRGGGHAQIGRSDMDRGVHYPLRAGNRIAGMGAGGRGLGGSSGPRYGSGTHGRGGRAVIDRYRGGGMDSRRSESPRRPHPLDHRSNTMGRMPPGMRPDSRVVRSRTPPASHRSVGHTDFSSVRNQCSPPPPPSSARWPSDKREVDFQQDWDVKRPLSRPRIMPPQRTSPHVVHGSFLTDDRDRQVLAGSSRQSPPVKGLVNASMNSSLRKSRDDSFELSRVPKRSEDEDVMRHHPGVFLKDREYQSSPMGESDRERERSDLYRRDRDREDDRRRDFRRSSSRDGRFSSGPKYVNAREADDDVAPRRRRPT